MSFGPEYIHGLQAVLNKNLPWGISKIEGGESWVALRVSARDGEWLLLSWGSGSVGCCLVDASSLLALKKGAPARAPLVEALKSRFLKGQILAARQLNFDRVLELEVVRFVAAGFGVKYFLILEVTEPTGNIILLDEDRRIEELARHASPDINRYRTLLPGHFYVPPPAFEGLLPLEIDRLERETLSRVKGIGRPLTRMIDARWEERSSDEWLEALRKLYTDVSLPCQRTPKGYFTRFPLAFEGAEQWGEDALRAAREGVLTPLLSGSRTRLLRDLELRVGRAVKSKERHLDGLLKQLQNNADVELFRRKGELLLAHAAAVPPRADRVSLSEWGSDEVLEIVLDPKLSGPRNAERYFKKYKKAKVDPKSVEDEIASLRGVIGELREQKDLLESIDDPEALEEAVRDVVDWLAPKADRRANGKKTSGKANKKEKDLPPHLRFDVDGYTIWVGLSARGNRFVTFKQATGDDLWLHVHEIPGAHVVIKGGKGRETLEGSDALAVAASLAAAHSRAKSALSVQVDYTERRYVRSIPGAAIALVTYVNPGTIRVNPTYWREYFYKRATSQDVHEAPRAEDI